MIIQPDHIERTGTVLELIRELHSLDDKDILELGCGRAELTRQIATDGVDRRVRALEVDEIQHALNAQITDLPNVRFELAGAEAIPGDDASADVVFMFKSLHHVPLELMDQALLEIHRVLRPGGQAHFLEPIYDGTFNDVLRLFHDERVQRTAAFEAIQASVERGRFELENQAFFLSPHCFPDFAEFETKVIRATHSNHELSDELYALVKDRFESHLGPSGAEFLQPIRIDVLRKPTRS